MQHSRVKSKLSVCFFLFLFPFLSIVLSDESFAQDAQEPSKEKAEKKDPALDQYYVANAAFNRKLYPVAAGQFESFLEKHPKHPKADLASQGLALSLYALKQYDKAMPHLEELLAKEEIDSTISRERLVMLLGQCLMISEKKSDAKNLFLKEIKIIKDKAYRVAALAAICDVSFNEQNWEEVESWADQLVSSKPSPEALARGLYQQGYAKYQLKKTNEAILSLSAIAQLEANKLWSTRANYLLGECYNILKDYAKAEVSFLAALPGLGKPESTECHYRLGVTRFILKKYTDSIENLSTYLKDQPEGKHAREAAFYIARSNLENKEYEGSGESFAMLSQGDGQIAAQASLWQARVLTRSEKNYDKASEILSDALERFSDSNIVTDIRYDLANSLMGKKTPDWKRALALLIEVEKDEGFKQLAELTNQKSVCQHRLTDYEGSLASTNEYIKNFPNTKLFQAALFLKAENLFLLKRTEEAAVAYDTYLQAGSNNSNYLIAQYRTAQIFHEQEDWENCLSVTASILENPPQGKLFSQLQFIVGDSLFRLKKWKDSTLYLNNFVTSNSSDEEINKVANLDTALMQLSVAHEKLGDIDKSIATLSLLVSKYENSTPHLPLALAEKGRISYQSGDLEIARSALERFIEEDQKGDKSFQDKAIGQRPRVMYYLGWINATEGKHLEASSNFAKVVELDSKHLLAPDSSLQQGVALLNLSKFKESSAHLVSVLKNFPEHPKLERVIYYAGISLARQSLWNEASIQFVSLIENYPKSSFADRALYELAWCNRGTEKIEEAVKLYEQIIENYPKSPLLAKVQSELAELNLEGGNTEKVIAQLTEALEGVKNDSLRSNIRYQLASAHLKGGDYKTAVVQFESMLKDYPESEILDRILFNAGECQFKLGEMEEAMGHFLAASKIENSSDALTESVLLRLGESQSVTGNYDSAQSTYKLFLDRFTQSRWRRNASFGLAMAVEKGGDPKTAIPIYSELLNSPKLDLWSVRSRYQLGNSYLELKQYEEAVVEFVNLEINYPQYPNWQAMSVIGVGRVLLEQKKNDQAAERFKEVLVKYDDKEALNIAQKYLDQLDSN